MKLQTFLRDMINMYPEMTHIFKTIESMHNDEISCVIDSVGFHSINKRLDDIERKLESKGKLKKKNKPKSKLAPVYDVSSEDDNNNNPSEDRFQVDIDYHEKEIDIDEVDTFITKLVRGK